MEHKDIRNGFEIDLRRVMAAVLHNLWIIVLVAAILAAACFSYAYFFIAPTYSANIKLYVNNSFNDDPGVSSSQISAAQDLAYTYMTILESRNVLDDVAAHSGLPYNAGQLRAMIDAAALNKTEVFQVKVTCSNYKHAAAIANAIADVLPDKVEQIVDGTSVRVIDRAVENSTRMGPDYKRYAMLGAAAGALLTVVLVMVADISDTTIVSEDYLSHVYHKTPLLAVIPDTQNSKSGYYRGYRGYYKGYYQHKEKRKQAEDGGEA